MSATNATLYTVHIAGRQGWDDTTIHPSMDAAKAFIDTYVNDAWDEEMPAQERTGDTERDREKYLEVSGDEIYLEAVTVPVAMLHEVIQAAENAPTN